MTPSGAQIPLGEVAKVDLGPGPSMIRDEDARLTGYVYIDLATSDYGGYVERAQRVLDRKLRLPPGYTLKWSGEYEFQLRARKRLSYILPIVFGVIFVLLYMLFHSALEATVLILPCLYAMTGGLILQYWMGFNFSVAVWVGYIALFGIAVETGVVMVIYLHEALDRRLEAGSVDESAIESATIEGAVAASAAQIDDRVGGDAEPCSHPLGKRNRCGRDEADRGPDRRRDGYLDDPRSDSGTGVFRAVEGTKPAPGGAAAGSG